VPEYRFGFEEDDESEHRPERADASAERNAETIEGSDPDRVVTVVVNPAGEVTTVRIAPRWRDVVEPRALSDRVMTAANAASMAAFARSVAEPTGQDDPSTGADPAPAPMLASNPMAAMDGLLKLMDVVSAELSEFEQRLSTITTGVISATSAGGHVQIGSQGSQVVSVAIDPHWVAAARFTEIETEALDALRQVQRRSAPGDLVQGPQSAAISELNRLVGNPQDLLRQLGLAIGNGPSKREDGV
jgi:DNA-binding protein YbaB